MSTNFGGLKLLTVPQSSNVSNILTLREYQDAYAIGLMGLSSQDGKTYTIEVTRDLLSEPDDVPTNWYTLQDGETLADVAVPAQGKAAVYPQLSVFSAFRIKASGSVSTAVTFEVSKSFYAPGGLR